MNPTISSNRLLRLNVGFLLNQGAGTTREVIFNYPGTINADDFIISGLDGAIKLTRTPQGILVQGNLLVQTPVECVRCLTPFDLLYEVALEELFVTGAYAQASGLSEEAPLMISEGGFIDLTPILREEGILAIPMQILCALDCKGLCPTCGQDLNQAACDCHTENLDPRWAALRALLED
jgi:uncharacterized protein